MSSKLSLPLSKTDSRVQRWLKSEFKKSNMSITAFAARLGYTRQFVSQVMDGTARFTLDTLTVVTKKLNASNKTVLSFFS